MAQHVHNPEDDEDEEEEGCVGVDGGWGGVTGCDAWGHVLVSSPSAPGGSCSAVLC